MAKNRQFNLIQDKKGMYWDLALYVPTVVALLSIGVQFWYSGNHNLAYLLVFASTFFFLIGFNRIAGTRLMLLPNSPLALEIGRQGVKLTLRSGECVDLIKQVRFFSDYAGKSFGLTGMDASGKTRQYVIHRGQFFSYSEFQEALSVLKHFK